MNVSRIAIVVTNPAEFGQARMFELMSESIIDRKIVVFNDFDEALDWLEAKK